MPIVVARRRRPERIEVVQDVDAADKGPLRVDHHDLSVHPAQPVAAQAERTDLGPEDEHLRAGLLEHGAKSRREIAGAEPVDDDVHCDPACRGPGQRIRHQAACFVVGEDVGFEEHFALRRIEGLDQRREELLAVPEEVEPVTRNEVQRHGRSSGPR